MAEECARARFPEAEIVYFETVADMAQNLRQKKIEAFAMNRIFVDELMASGQKLPPGKSICRGRISLRLAAI